MNEPATINRMAVVVLPTEAYLAWANENPDPMPDLTRDGLRDEATVYLLPLGRSRPREERATAL